MNQLVYLCYGRGAWIDEIGFSILSALRWIDVEEARRTILVLSDVPADAFARLPCRVEPIDPELMRQWAGPMGFSHRRKIPAMRYVLEKFGGGAVLLDGDTYFTRSPILLFDRIGPGRSIMHMREGTLGILQGDMHRALADLLATRTLRDANGSLIPQQTDMWNAGVVGLNAADVNLLDEVLRLADEVYGRLKIHTAEQFAFSYVLGKRTRRSECADAVFHYWLPYLHEPFRAEAGRLLHRYGDLPMPQRARKLYAHRPRPRGIVRFKLSIKNMAQPLGLLRDRLRAQG